MSQGSDIKLIGVNDHQVDLFEGQFPVPDGMAYNSYFIEDEKLTVIDTVDAHFGEEWLGNVSAAADGRAIDYLIVQHMEPDHSANVVRFLAAYPQATVVASAPAFRMMKAYFGDEYAARRIVVKDGDTLSTGRHQLHFVTAPMVHWPEVIFTYDATAKALFSADAFGKFGALDTTDPDDWDCEARRYYFGIVGKFGPQVCAALAKTTKLPIEAIYPLHGPAHTTPEKIAHVLQQYTTWSNYAVETKGVVIAYTSVYGHTREVVLKLKGFLEKKGCDRVVVADLARDEMFETIEDAFRHDRLVLATTTYNNDIFPPMRHFIEHLVARNFQKRRVGLIENGTWAPQAAKVMKALLVPCKDLVFIDPIVTVNAALTAQSEAQLTALADALIQA